MPKCISYNKNFGQELWGSAYHSEKWWKKSLLLPRLWWSVAKFEQGVSDDWRDTSLGWVVCFSYCTPNALARCFLNETCLDLGYLSFADQRRCTVVQIKLSLGNPLAGYGTGERVPLCVLQGKPRLVLVTVFLPCFADCQMFLLSYCPPFYLSFPVLFGIIFQLFGHTLASVWMSPRVKNRSCWYSCQSLPYYFSVFWWFRRAYTLCKLNSKYDFLLTRQEKYDLRKKWKASVLRWIINNWNWLNCQKIPVNKFWLMCITIVIKKISFLCIVCQRMHT